MPYHADWYIPLRVAEARFWGKVDSGDLDRHSEACVRLLTEAQVHAPGRLIHLILDVSEVEVMPPTYLMMSRALPTLRFKNRDTMFVIAPKSASRSILEITAHVMNFKIRTFSTRDEALRAVEAVLLKDELHSS
jgi:hypothetical protein